MKMPQIAHNTTINKESLNSEELICRYLSHAVPHGSIIGSHHIQLDLPRWIEQQYGQMFNPDTLMRKFRGIKNTKQFMLRNAGVTLEEVNQGSREKNWKVLNNL
jgi:hypothetical protein